MFLASNRYSELQEVARQINRLVQEKKYRYRDIAVITKNQNEYASLIKVIFDIEKIPVFIDEKKDLSENIFVKFILSVLEIFAKGWSQEAVFSSIKTGFFDLTKEDIFKIENYCMCYGIDRKMWYEKDWEFDTNIENINELRKKIVEPLLKFQTSLKCEKTVINMTKKLYEFLEEMQVEKTLNEKIRTILEANKSEVAEEYISSMKIVTDTLDQLIELFGDETISFEKYQELLKIGFKVEVLGKIPESIDQVTLGDVERSRSHKVKAVFIVGVNDGIFPSFQKEEGFLNDKERKELKELGMELAKGSYENLYEDQFNIYKAFSVAEEELYVSYISSDKEGKALRPSVLIYRLKKIFLHIVEESDVVQKKLYIENEFASFETLLEVLQKKKLGENVDDKWEEVYNYFATTDKWKQRLNTVLKGMGETNEVQKIEKRNIHKLYGNVLKTSVSKLEQYRKCPFSFHLKYGLRLKEKPEFKLKNIDTGSFMHEVIEKFFEYIDTYTIDIKQINEDEIQKIISKVIEKILELPRNYLFSCTPKFCSLTSSLKKVVTKSIIYIVYQLQRSDFEVCGTEVEFSDNSVYEPIRLELDTGEKIEVTGKIDRIDIAKIDGGKYIRIIDYKSSARSIDLNEVLAGLQIQLLTYMDVASRIEGAIPAGILYFGLLDHVAKKGRTDEEIEKEIRKQFKMNGMILADVKVIKMMDNSLDKGYSETLPVFLDKEGNLSITRSNVITKQQFEYMQEYTKRIIKNLSNEILQGNIEIKPYYDVKSKKSVCEYCKYKGICDFNLKKQSYFQIPQFEKQTLLNKMEEENNNVT